LLFDEATSALDDRTEQEINHSINRLADENSSLTMLIIAHRESSLTACNRIINLEKQPNNE
jgi:ABC-type multidrug transport system fused ATPase/permease subunit